jgi:aromatic-L-amino-acid decarboxylase
VRRIPVDDSFRMSPSGLAQAIREDREANVLPMAVVATVGTTSTTSVDPVDEIADICAESGVWLHVDAAYGGAAALVPGMRRLMAGWDRADSIVTNPHKWMFVPLDCSALFFRDAAAAVRAWSLTPDYLATPEDAAVTNLMEYGPALGRRFRALKLWMTLRYFGRTGLAARLEEHMRLARLFAGWVDQEDSWSLEAPVPFSAVCFRYAPNGFPASELDRANEGILDRVNASGEVFLSHTRLRGRFVLRLAIGNIRTGERQVARAWDLLREASKVAS